jgi:hypothetical protein
MQVASGMTGTWAGTSAVLGDSTELTRIEILIVIAPDGHVTGMVGGAVLRNAQLEWDRGFFGRLFGYGRDWKIAGNLDGLIVPCNGPPLARLVMSLDWVSDHFDGGFVAAMPQIRGHREILASSGPLRLDRVR